MKIGFFGGCFNPPTNAHIYLAKKVLKECKLDKVIFVPVGDFYNKKELISAEHRYNMLKISCKRTKKYRSYRFRVKVKREIVCNRCF